MVKGPFLAFHESGFLLLVYRTRPEEVQPVPNVQIGLQELSSMLAELPIPLAIGRQVCDMKVVLPRSSREE